MRLSYTSTVYILYAIIIRQSDWPRGVTKTLKTLQPKNCHNTKLLPQDLNVIICRKDLAYLDLTYKHSLDLG